MKTRAALLFALILPSLLCAQPAQVLVTIGQEQITAKDLQSAVASSPFADQFTTVDPDAQAEMRGSLLKHLVTAKLLYLEAKRKGLHGFAITDHNTCACVDYFIQHGFMRENGEPVNGLLIIPGQEITTSEGHLLALGVRLPDLKGISPVEAIELIHSAKQ